MMILIVIVIWQWRLLRRTRMIEVTLPLISDDEIETETETVTARVWSAHRKVPYNAVFITTPSGDRLHVRGCSCVRNAERIGKAKYYTVCGNCIEVQYPMTTDQ